MRRIIFVVLCVIAFATPSSIADLDTYIKTPDASYGWSVVSTQPLPGVGTMITVDLTSLTWQGIPWKHWLIIVRPEPTTAPEHALLVVSGGRNRSDPPKPGADAMMLASVAKTTGAVIAVLNQVPNEPLFGDLREDGLIAYTFQKYIETGDETWPCLLPMTKSAVRAMDATETILREQFGAAPSKWTVTGASKRGWTTWLTAAVDPRVVAIAPMVIDTLNMPAQMKLQVATFGQYSEQIEEYTKIHMQDGMETPAGKKLLAMVDPYEFRKRLTMPKQLVLGTNDRYWPVDAVTQYFPDLEGEKYIHYVANAGHGLGPEAAEVTAAFWSTVIHGETRPRFTWTTTRADGTARLKIAATDAPGKVALWQAAADTRDFRDAKWAVSPLTAAADGGFEAALKIPAEGYAAFYANLTFQTKSGQAYVLSTNVEVIGDKAKVVEKPEEGKK